MKHKKKMQNMKQRLDEDLHAGFIYKSIVRKAYVNKYPERDEKELEEVLFHGKMDEIEAQIDIKWVIERVVEVLRSALTEEGIRLPGDFVEVVLYSQTPEEDVEEVVIEVKLRRFDDEGKDELRKDVLMELKPLIHYKSSRVIDEVYLEDVFRLLELDTGRVLGELY